METRTWICVSSEEDRLTFNIANEIEVDSDRRVAIESCASDVSLKDDALETFPKICYLCVWPYALLKMYESNI